VRIARVCVRACMCVCRGGGASRCCDSAGIWQQQLASHSAPTPTSTTEPGRHHAAGGSLVIRLSGTVSVASPRSTLTLRASLIFSHPLTRSLSLSRTLFVPPFLLHSLSFAHTRTHYLYPTVRVRACFILCVRAGVRATRKVSYATPLA